MEDDDVKKITEILTQHQLSIEALGKRTEELLELLRKVDDAQKRTVRLVLTMTARAQSPADTDAEAN